MAYCTYDDYLRYGASGEMPEEDFNACAERATDIIDELTFFKLHHGVFEALSEYDRNQVVRATCAQVEHLYYQGIETSFSGATSGSYRIGSTSITRSVGGQSGSGSMSRVSPLAKRLLTPTGLLYRGVTTE